MIRALENRTYRRLFAAQLMSLAGTGLTTVALALLAWELAGDRAGVVLGVALALKMVAYVGVSQLAGAFLGHLPRRGLLIGLDLARAAMVLLLPFASAVWHIYALVFFYQSCSAAFTPTFQATIPDILTDERDYGEALSLSRLAYDLESLASPLAAAALLTVIGFDALFVLTTFGFLASAGLVASVGLPARRAETPEGGIWARVGKAARYYLETPPLRGLLALNLAVAAAASMVIVNSVVYARDTLGGGETLYTGLLAAYGVGSMLVALGLRPILERLQLRQAMLAGGGLLVAASLSGALEPGLPGAVATWFAIGAGASLVLTPSGLLLRRMSTDETRTDIFTAQFALSHACWLVAYPLAGWLGAGLGLGPTFLVMAGLAAAGALAATRLWRPRDEQPLTHTHPPLQHEHLHVHDDHHQHPHEGWESPEPHRHPHRHGPLQHAHAMAIDRHHPYWPER